MLFPLDTGIAICAYLYNLYGFSYMTGISLGTS